MNQFSHPPGPQPADDDRDPHADSELDAADRTLEEDEIAKQLARALAAERAEIDVELSKHAEEAEGDKPTPDDIDPEVYADEAETLPETPKTPDSRAVPTADELALADNEAQHMPDSPPEWTPPAGEDISQQ